MALNDLDSIRDIYAFPKDGKGRLMMDSPVEVNKKQLEEIHQGEQDIILVVWARW